MIRNNIYVKLFILQEWANRNLAIVFMYSMALSSIICNIFILCYIGEQLTLQVYLC